MKTESTHHIFTLRSAFMWLALSMLLSASLGIFLAAYKIYLFPPWFRYTPVFYWLLWLAPVLVVLGFCIRARPVGSRLMWVAISLLGILIFAFYAVLLGPAFYTSVRCAEPVRSGLSYKQACTCGWQGSSEMGQTPCTFHGINFLPWVRLSLP